MKGIALGCSHTSGVAIAPLDCYVSQLARLMSCTIDNHGVAGGNHMHVQNHLVAALTSTDQLDFIVAQWPNPFRLTIWQNEMPRNENIHTASVAFTQLLRASEQNFYQSWIQAIIICNLLCRANNTPIVNIMIENVADQYHAQLANYGIILHVDRKLPDQTWLMDSAADDNLHHSAHCHQQWAKRLFGLLNEYTTP